MTVADNMPDLAELDAFTAVARAGGFRSAAVLRGVSASSLSEALRRLEARLGVRLFNRTTRSVTLTEAGAQLYERLTPALVEVGADGRVRFDKEGWTTPTLQEQRAIIYAAQNELADLTELLEKLQESRKP